jgi:hypothetical protein
MFEVEGLLKLRKFDLTRLHRLGSSFRCQKAEASLAHHRWSRIGKGLTLISFSGPSITRPETYQDLWIMAVQPAHAGVHLGPHTRSAGPTI